MIAHKSDSSQTIDEIFETIALGMLMGKLADERQPQFSATRIAAWKADPANQEKMLNLITVFHWQAQLVAAQAQTESVFALVEVMRDLDSKPETRRKAATQILGMACDGCQSPVARSKGAKLQPVEPESQVITDECELSFLSKNESIPEASLKAAAGKSRSTVEPVSAANVPVPPRITLSCSADQPIRSAIAAQPASLSQTTDELSALTPASSTGMNAKSAAARAACSPKPPRSSGRQIAENAHANSWATSTPHRPSPQATVAIPA